MKTTETTLVSAAETVGSWVFLSLTLILGPGGFVLLGGMAYAMLYQNLALGVVCGLVVFSPFLLAAIWVPLCGAAWALTRSEAGKEFAADLSGV